MAYVDETADGLCTTDLYDSLDATEKGAASYRIGMGIAKIIAERKLHVPWMRHIDPLIRQGIIQTDQKTHERPDMVGQSPDNQWHIIEAKGRSNSDREAMRKGKLQAAAVNYVAGSIPHTKSACVTELCWNSIYTDLEKVTGTGSIELHMQEQGVFRREYYGLVQGMAQLIEPIEYRLPLFDSPRNLGVFQLFMLPGTKYALGVQHQIYEMVTHDEDDSLSDFWNYFYSSDGFGSWHSRWYDYQWSTGQWSTGLRSTDVPDVQSLSIGLDGYLLLRTAK